MKYLSKADLANFLNLGSDKETYLERLGNLAEGFFNRKVGRYSSLDTTGYLIHESQNTTERFDGGFVFRLTKYPVREIESVKTNASGTTPSLVDSSNYEFDFRKLYAKAGFNISWRDVEITYKGGFDIQGAANPTFPVPEDVKLVIVELVRVLYDPDNKKPLPIQLS